MKNFMKKINWQKQQNQGFTLLEILVVISIMGILIALGTAAFSTAQKKGRDARREADIKAIQQGMEQYNAKNGIYPASSAELEADTEIFPSGLPEDPRSRDLYVYTINTEADAFCVCALLESGAGNSSALPAAAAASDCLFGDGDYYCETNLQ